MYAGRDPSASVVSSSLNDLENKITNSLIGYWIEGSSHKGGEEIARDCIFCNTREVEGRVEE